MMKNKRGAEGVMWFMIILIIALVVLVLVVPWVSKGIFGGKDTLGVISPGASSYSISSCNAYCDFLRGEDISSSSIIVTDANIAKQNYCNDIRTFVYVKDNKEKEVKMTCAQASTKSNGQVTDCKSLAKCTGWNEDEEVKK